MIAICWPKNFYPSIHFSPDWNDFLRGLFFGLAISFFCADGDSSASPAAQRLNPAEHPHKLENP